MMQWVRQTFRSIDKELSSFEELVFVRIRKRTDEICLPHSSKKPIRPRSGQSDSTPAAQQATRLKSETEKFLIKAKHLIVQQVNDLVAEFDMMVSEHNHYQLNSDSPARMTHKNMKMNSISTVDGYLMNRVHNQHLLTCCKNKQDVTKQFKTCPGSSSTSGEVSIYLSDIMKYKLELNSNPKKTRCTTPDTFQQSYSNHPPLDSSATEKRNTSNKTRRGLEWSFGTSTLDEYLKTAPKYRQTTPLTALSKHTKTPTHKHLFHKSVSCEKSPIHEDISVIKQKINEVISKRMAVRREKTSCVSKYAIPTNRCPSYKLN